MREKPANEAAVQRLISFLKMVQFQAKGNPNIINFNSLQEDEGVAKRTASDCRALDIIKADGNKTIWIPKEPVDFRLLALKILDHRLKRTKKTIHFPIPDFAGIADSLKEISERLMYLTVQQEKFLKTAKTGQIESADNSATLFTEEQQRHKDRVYLLGQIAGSYFSDLTPYNSSDPEVNASTDQANISARSKTVFNIVDNLLEKLYTKNNQ